MKSTRFCLNKISTVVTKKWYYFSVCHSWPVYVSRITSISIMSGIKTGALYSYKRTATTVVTPHLSTNIWPSSMRQFLIPFLHVTEAKKKSQKKFYLVYGFYMPMEMLCAFPESLQFLSECEGRWKLVGAITQILLGPK